MRLSSLARSIPKHNVLIIGGYMNAQIGKNGRNRHSFHNTSNRNGQHLTEFMMENRLSSSSSSCRASSMDIPDPHSLHVSLLFIASGRSSGLHSVSSHSCFMYVRASRRAFDWPYAGVHGSAPLKSSSLLLQQCPACLVRLAWIVFVISGRWPYSWCLVKCCCQDLLNIALNILV